VDGSVGTLRLKVIHVQQVVLLVFQDLLVLLVHKVCKERKVFKVSKELLVQQVLLVPLVLKVSKELQVQ
jgi:hypothetical protein